MGMNYYIVSKNNKQNYKKIQDAYKQFYQTNNLDKKIKSTLMKEFEPIINIVELMPKYKHKLEYFEERLDKAIKKFSLDLKFDVLDVFDFEEEERIHIGKCSYGWLFLFQIQDTVIDGICFKWHSYNQVKAWLEEYVNKRKLFVIKNEDGGEVTVEELIKLIDKKQKDPKDFENPDNFSHCINVDGYRFTHNDFS